MRETR